MATHIVMFRLDYNSTYTDRWSSVVNAIRAEADDNTWEEMTSIIVLKSSKSAEDLARSIYLYSDFDTSTDKLLVVNSTNNTHATRGEIDYPATLAAFFDSGLARSLSALMG